jgi:hypothetical protein
MTSLEKRLEAFRTENKFNGKGQLCVALHLTRLAKEEGLPIDNESLRTPKAGQVKGLGKARVQSILEDHDIVRVLAEEGGRTSRGSMGNAQNYMAFLDELHEEKLDDLNAIEDWWIARVKEFFSGKPFSLKFDPSKSLQSLVGDLLAQALKRQKENPGTTYAGTMLQHLVGAKLDLILKDEEKPLHHGANVADQPTDRAGDFVYKNAAIHATTAPGEALMRKCRDNIDAGLHPIIVTIASKREVALSLADDQDLAGRIEIIDAEQFIASNILEWSKFDEKKSRVEIKKLIDRYNEIVEEAETDPALRIEI